MFLSSESWRGEKGGVRREEGEQEWLSLTLRYLIYSKSLASKNKWCEDMRRACAFLRTCF